MKSNQNGSQPQTNHLQVQSKTSSPTCEFINYLTPSNVILDQQQKEEDYNQIYKALSEGVYQSSDAFQVDESNNQNYEQIENQSKQTSNTNQLNPSLKKEDNNLQSSKIMKKSIMEQDEDEEFENKEVQESKQQVQSQQNKKVQTIPENKLQNQQQEFVFAESMSHYESVMQFVYPSLMQESLSEKVEQQRLQQIEEQNDIQEQTNQIHLEIHQNKQINHEDQKTQKTKEFTIPKPQTIQKNEVQKPQKRQQSYSPARQRLRMQNNSNQIWKIKSELHKFTTQMQSGKINITISGYQKQYFLKIQTQLYHIDVHKGDTQYSIKRRFADFATLEQLIRFQFSGFILYPFPEITLQFFKKMKFSISSEQERIVLIEKRLFELEKYINFLFCHEQISTSFLLQVFIQQNYQSFQKQMNNIKSISLSQERQMQLGVIEKNYNNIKKLVKTNFTFLKGYFAVEDNEQRQKLEALQLRCRKNDDFFALIRNQYETFMLTLDNFSTKIHRIYLIYKQNSQTANLQSNIDAILSFSSKLSSSRPFYNKYAELIEDHIISEIKYYHQLLEAIQASLKYREQLINKVNSLEPHQCTLGDRIQQKIRNFEDRFIKDWKKFSQQLENNTVILYQKCNLMWKNHCRLMKKIWK